MSDIENMAVEEFKQKVIKRFGNAEFILFSSKARGDGVILRYNDKTLYREVPTGNGRSN